MDSIEKMYNQLGPEIMSKPAGQLTPEDLFKIFHVTKNFNGADDGVFPMIQANLEKLRPLLINKLSRSDTSIEHLASAKEMIYLFFNSDKELTKLVDI